MKLSLAIVTYHSDRAMLEGALDSVVAAIAFARRSWPALSVDFYLIDNDPAASSSTALAARLVQLGQQGIAYVEVIHSGKNPGYGAGHNACLHTPCQKPLASDYHLILNPDIVLAEDFLAQGLAFLEKEKAVAIVAPYVENEDGTPAYLCKRYPAVFDLFLRGFTPACVRSLFRQRLDHYQMKDLYDAQQTSTAVPIISGCCMLLRTGVFRELNGFDERFFLYFEDFDLSLRIAAKGKLAYHPALRIRHFGGFSARKGFWHIQQFVRSASLFFGKHGWRWV